MYTGKHCAGDVYIYIYTQPIAEHPQKMSVADPTLAMLPPKRAADPLPRLWRRLAEMMIQTKFWPRAATPPPTTPTLLASSARACAVTHATQSPWCPRQVVPGSRAAIRGADGHRRALSSYAPDHANLDARRHPCNEHDFLFLQGLAYSSTLTCLCAALRAGSATPPRPSDSRLTRWARATSPASLHNHNTLELAVVRLHTVLMETHSFYPCLDAWRLTGGARELFYVSAYPAHVADVVMTHAPGHVVTVTYAVWSWHGPEAFEGGWATGVAILHGYGPRATRGSVDLPRLGRPHTRARAPAFASCCIVLPHAANHSRRRGAHAFPLSRAPWIPH